MVLNVSEFQCRKPQATALIYYLVHASLMATAAIFRKKLQHNNIIMSRKQKKKQLQYESFILCVVVRTSCQRHHGYAKHKRYWINPCSHCSILEEDILQCLFETENYLGKTKSNNLKPLLIVYCDLSSCLIVQRQTFYIYQNYCRKSRHYFCLLYCACDLNSDELNSNQGAEKISKKYLSPGYNSIKA